MKKKKMVYAKVSDYKSPYRILYSGTCKGYRIVIVNMHGIHPCAYIQVPFDEIDNSDVVERISDNLSCHGGVTYVGDIADACSELGDTPAKHTWIGWDYGHLCDYRPKPTIPKGIHFPLPEEFTYYHRHKWTTEEVYRDVISACKSLNDIMVKLKDSGFID